MVLNNAAKYSQPGIAIKMEVAKHDAHHARVSITDEGPSIPRELRERVFERFFRRPSPVAQRFQGADSASLSQGNS